MTTTARPRNLGSKLLGLQAALVGYANPTQDNGVAGTEAVHIIAVTTSYHGKAHGLTPAVDSCCSMMRSLLIGTTLTFTMTVEVSVQPVLSVMIKRVV